MYTYSKNYARLYQLLCAGVVVVAWVDYRVRHQTPEHNAVVQRDICQIVREKAWDIQFFVRGMSYGRVIHSPWQTPQRTEEEQFVFACETLRVEYIVGTAGDDALVETPIADH